MEREQKVFTLGMTFQGNQELSSDIIPAVHWRILFLRPVMGLYKIQSLVIIFKPHILSAIYI